MAQAHSIAPRRRAAKDARIDVRLSPERKNLLLRAAALRGESLSDFVLSSAQREAERAIETHSVITLTERDSAAFAQALANPPAPSRRMREAAQRYLATMGE